MSDSNPWMCETFSVYLDDKNFFDHMIDINSLSNPITYDDMFASMLDEASNLNIDLPDIDSWDYEYYFYHLQKKKIAQKVDEFYNDNQSELDSEWEHKVSCGEWGSGKDRIKISDQMFYEFLESKYFEQGEQDD